MEDVGLNLHALHRLEGLDKMLAGGADGSHVGRILSVQHGEGVKPRFGGVFDCDDVVVEVVDLGLGAADNFGDAVEDAGVGLAVRTKSRAPSAWMRRR